MPVSQNERLTICHNHQTPHVDCGCPSPQEESDRRHRELSIISLEDEAYYKTLEEMYENGEAPV